jgi:hypothetical protein
MFCNFLTKQFSQSPQSPSMLCPLSVLPNQKPGAFWDRIGPQKIGPGFGLFALDLEQKKISNFFFFLLVELHKRNMIFIAHQSHLLQSHNYTSSISPSLSSFSLGGRCGGGTGSSGDMGESSGNGKEGWGEAPTTTCSMNPFSVVWGKYLRDC